MGLDTWLEQDMRVFLDDEVKAGQQPQPARIEDAASIMSDHNWIHEIKDQVKRGDVDSAKQLYAMLRLRYQQTPQGHDAERAQLHDLLKESYVTIANLVLDKYRTGELLRRMEASPGDPFNMKIKSVNLALEDGTGKAPSAIDFLPFTKDAIGASPIFKDLAEVAPGSNAKDHLSFDPEALLKANQELARRVQEAREAASVTDQTVRDLIAALTLALKDPRGALVAIDAMLQKPLAQDVRAASTELRAAIVDREEMLGFTKQANIELQRLSQLAQARPGRIHGPLTATPSGRW